MASVGLVKMRVMISENMEYQKSAFALVTNTNGTPPERSAQEQSVDLMPPSYTNWSEVFS